jgi:hypothetical protein
MSTTQPTEAHRKLWSDLYNLAHREIFEDYAESSDGPATQLIADSEARSVERALAIKPEVIAYPELEMRLTAERERVRVLREALDNLRDEQNGAPLCTREEEWKEAMEKADAALAATELKT